MNKSILSFATLRIESLRGAALTWLFCGVASASDFLGQANLIDVLPSTTQMVVTAQSVQKSYTLLESSNVGKHLSGPIWQTVKQKQIGTNTGSLLHPKPWLGLEWQDVRSMEQAGAVAAFLDSNGETAFVFLAKLGPNADKQPCVQRWIANQGGMSQFQSLPGTEPTPLFASKGDAKAAGSVCIAFGSQWTCISSSARAVQEWLKTPTVKSMKAAASPGSDQPVFSMTAWGDGETRFWLSPWAILSSYAKKEPKLVRSAKLFGMDGILALSGSLSPPTPNETAWKLTYNQLLAAPFSKGLAMLSFKNGPMVEAPKILSDAMDQVGIAYLDMKPWFQGVTHALDQVIDEETPGGFADLVDSILTDPEGPKIDLRKELIYPAGPLMVSFGATAPDKKKPGQFQHNQVWALAIPDSKKAIATVNRLFENDKDIKNEQIGSFQVWSTANDESLFVAINKGDTQTISIAAIDSQYLYVSTDTAWLKGLLGGGAANGANAKRPALWKSYLQKLKPTSFSMQQAIDLSSWLERSWARLPEPEHKDFQSTDLPAYCLTKALVPGCNAAEIPKWSQIQSVFGVMMQTTVRSDQGIQGQIWLTAKP